VQLGMAAVVYDVDGVLLVVGLLPGDSDALEGGYDGFDVLLLLQLLMALLRGAGVGGWGRVTVIRRLGAVITLARVVFREAVVSLGGGLAGGDALLGGR
jgi:hypothetical protein